MTKTTNNKAAKVKIGASFEARLDEELASLGLLLVELKKFQVGSTQTVRVTICDPHKSVGHDQCTEATRLIHSIEPTLRESYNLEVWSPGADRELKTEREFKVFAGREVILSFDNSSEQKKENDQVAKLINKIDDSITVLIGGKETEMKLSEIKTIKLAPQKPDSDKPIEISLEDI